MGDTLSRTIIGIGLNVNQREFPAELPNPTSMAIERGVAFDRREVVEALMRNVERWYAVLERGDKALIEQSYREAHVSS